MPYPGLPVRMPGASIDSAQAGCTLPDPLPRTRHGRNAPRWGLWSGGRTLGDGSANLTI